MVANRRARAQLGDREVLQLQAKVPEGAQLAVDLLAKGRAVAAATNPPEVPELLPCRCQQALPRFDLALQALARHLRR